MRNSTVLPARRTCLLLAILLAVGLFIQPVGAQVLYGTVVGNVTDESGAVVPEATVTLTNKGTGQTREAVTNESGDYSVPNLLPGVYDIKVSKQGFSTFNRADQNVTVNTVTRVDVQMKVGNVTDIVNVTADAAILQADTAEVKSSLSGKEINVLPMNQFRNYQALLNLVPGVNPGTTAGGFQNAITDSPARALASFVNGTAKNINNTRLDGATNTFIWLPHHTVYVAPSETIQEVNITTNSFDAEQGLAGGAAVTVQTKSGTNDLHGSVFGYHTNQDLQARNFFLPRTQQKPTSKIDIFGGTIGGPILRDKLFYFFGYERTTNRVGFFRFYTVPTAEVRAGNFSSTSINVFDPASGPVGSRTQFANNRIPANRISPISQKILALVPLPNLPGTTNNFIAAATEGMNRDNFDTKINWNRTSSHQIWGKFSMMDAQVNGTPGLGAAGGQCLCSGGTGTGDTKVYVVTIGSTLTMRTNWVVDGNFGFTRMNQQVLGHDFGSNFGSEVLGIPGTNGPDPRQSGQPSFAVSGYSTLGQVDTWTPIFRNDQSFTGTLNFSHTRGAHDIRFGYDMVRHELNHYQPEIGLGPRGGFIFGGGSTVNSRSTALNQFNAYAEFLLGYVSSAGTAAGKSLQYEDMTGREWQFGWYVRDRWQASKNLTLTLGLRYEYYPLMKRKDRGIERLDLNTFNVLIGGRGDVPEDVGIKVSKKLFAPRLGIAYRLGDDTVIRAGYGLTYDPLPFSRPLRGFYPLTIAQDLRGVDAFTPFTTLAQGIPEIVGPDLSTGRVRLPNGVFNRTPPEGLIHRGYVQSWNLMLERKLPGELIVQTGYVGTKTTHQLADLNINAAAPGQGNAGRPYASRGYTSDINYWDGYLSANYHAWQTSVNRRFSGGLFLKGAYTYSKAINMTDEDGWASVNWNHPSVFHRNRAVAGYDLTHNLQLGFAAELPFGKGKPFVSEGAASTILGGWMINGVFSARSGFPFTITASGASLNAPGNLQTADQVGAFTKLKNVGPGQSWFDPSSFVPVTAVRFGNTGRNAFRGPGYGNIDLSLFRSFTLTERFRMEFRAEAFNATNTPHFFNPGGNASAAIRDASGRIINSNGFGEVRSSFGERSLRFGLRLAF